MPDHYHILVKINESGNFSHYISIVENSFSRYFNLKNKRKGPLWQSRFRSAHITSNEQLLHVSRYIHLNPTTSQLIKKPEEWLFSSYREIITEPHLLQNILTEISILNRGEYKKFVENQRDYQIGLKIIKRKLLE